MPKVADRNNFVWDDVSTVLFDMDGTILDLHFDNYFWLEYLPKHYAETNNLSYELAHEKLTTLFANKRGSLDWYCLNYWEDQLKTDIVALKHDIKHKIAYRPRAEEFIRLVKDMGKECILVTNAHPKSLNIKLQKCNLNDHFETMISTHDYGFAKEHQELWPLLEKDLGFCAKQTLLIDDSESVLNSAKDFGIEHLMSIAFPDSQQQERQQSDFYTIECFSDLYPKI